MDLKYNNIHIISFDHSHVLYVIALPSLVLLFLFFKIRPLLFPPINNRSTVQLSSIHLPVIGAVPVLLWNVNRIVLFLTGVLLQSNGSFMFKGPWFSKMELFVTSDPVNVQHIMAKRYDDFKKGANFHKIFEVLGDGILNSDGDLWKYQRKIAHAALTSFPFRKFSASTVRDKLQDCMIPILEHAYENNLVVDLQDLLIRFTSDITFITIMGHDPGSLSMDLPKNPVSDYIHHIEEVLIWRHILPESVWRLQRWLGIGKEKTCKESIDAMHHFFFEAIAEKKQQVEKAREEDRDSHNGTNTHHEVGKDLLSLYIMENHGTPDHGFKSITEFLRDTLSTFVSAGQDTTSAALTWFFWLLAKNREVENKIKYEIREKTNVIYSNSNNFYAELERASGNLVYLHGAICETLRLYPPISLNHKTSLEPVVLPSGHKINPWTIIILNCYGMGRMKSIWGDDCLEFKPERWITDRGTIKHEPSYKFFTFNAGPRICLGKDIALMQMKMTILVVFHLNFHFQVIEGQTIEPQTSIVLGMKHGLKVKIVKQDI